MTSNSEQILWKQYCSSVSCQTARLNEIVMFINNSRTTQSTAWFDTEPNSNHRALKFIRLLLRLGWMGHYRTIRGFSSQLSSCLKSTRSSVFNAVFLIFTTYWFWSVEPWSIYSQRWPTEKVAVSKDYFVTDSDYPR